MPLPQKARQEALTLADELRAVLDQCVIDVANLTRNPGSRALALLRMLDKAESMIAELEEAGMDLRAERTRLDTVERQLHRQASVLVRALGGEKALAQARAEVEPERWRWWWYLDEEVARMRRRTLYRWLQGGAVVALLIIAAVAVYHFFLAPEPEVAAQWSHIWAMEERLREGDFSGALKECEAALALVPDNPQTLLWRGIILEQLGRETEAAEAFAIAREVISNDVDYWLERAMLYFQVGAVDAALEDAQAALDRDPEAAQAYYLLGSAYEMQGKIPEAMVAFQQAAQLADAQGDAKLFATVRMRMGMLLQAMPLLELTETPAGSE